MKSKRNSKPNSIKPFVSNVIFNVDLELAQFKSQSIHFKNATLWTNEDEE